MNGVTLASASTQVLNKDGETLKANKDSATKVGKAIAEAALAKKIESCVFDRSGYIYHGKVKALADGAVKPGLNSR